MYLISIQGIDLDDLGYRGTVTNESGTFDMSVRTRERSAGASYVGAAVQPRTYALTIQPEGADDPNEDRLLAILNIPREEELIVRATRLEDPNSVVVARASVSQIDRRKGGNIFVSIVASDPYWYAETPASRQTEVEDQAIIQVPVTGGRRVAPKLRFQPIVQRSSGTANHGATRRRRFTVQNLGLTSSWYRLPLRLNLGKTNDEVTAGKMLSSGNDVRVFHEGREIPRTLVNHNNASLDCGCWIILPSLGPGESTVFEVAYRNPQAGAPPVLAYPDLPPFKLASSFNDLWVYAGALTAGNAGLGGWYTNAGTAPPTLVDFDVPGAWRRVLTLPSGPNRDDVSQRRWTSYSASGVKYMGIFDAVRYRAGVAALQDEGLADGVVLYHPLGIEKVNVGLAIENRDSLTGGGGVATGKVMILARNTGAQDWATLLEDTTVRNDTIAATDYTPPAPVRQVAFAVWPANEREIPEALGADRFCSARWNTDVSVSIDDTALSIVETQTEEECYEVDLHVRTGSEPDAALLPPTHHLYAGGGNLDRNRRLTMRLNEHLVIDCERRTAQIWNQARTTVVEDVSAYAVAARKAVSTGIQSSTLVTAPEWLPLDPDYSAFDNPSFEDGLNGWVEEVLESITHTFGAVAAVAELAFFAAQGGSGSGNGQFADPRGIAVDSQGRVWVTDEDNERIQRLSPSLVYQVKAGGVGTGDGQFASNNGPHDLAIDASDRVWVLDRGNRRLQRFSPDAVFQEKMGLATHGLTGATGGLGTGTGEFSAPQGIAVNSTGDLLVADTGNERVQRLSGTLAYEDAVGALGAGNGQFAADNGAWGVAIDGSDNVWVVDRGHHRIQKFTSSLVYQSQIDGAIIDWVLQTTVGPQGSGAGQFNLPSQVARDSGGNVYVADFGNNRVQKLTSSGVWVSTITGLKTPAGVAVDASDNVYVLEYGSGDYRVRKYTAAGALVWTSPYAIIYGQYLATDSTHLYITSVGSSKVFKVLCSTGALVSDWGSAGSGDGQFNTPVGIATDGTHVYVADYGNHRIQKFTTTGTFVAKWGTNGSGNGQLRNPAGVALESGGDVWVSDAGNNRLQEFSNTGTFKRTLPRTSPSGLAFAAGDVLWSASSSQHTLQKWDEQDDLPGSGNGQMNGPTGLAIKQSSGRLYVVDTGNSRVQYFTAAGAYEGKWGGAGIADGQFTTPVAIAVNQSSANVYVVDQGNRRIQRFGATGTFGLQWGSQGSGDGQFQSPTAIAVNPADGHVFVLDSGRDDIQEFDADGVFVRRWGSSVAGDTQFSDPCGLAFNAAGTELYVVDAGNHTVKRFSLTDYVRLAIHRNSGRIYVVDTGLARVVRLSSTGALEGVFGSLGSGAGQLNAPDGIAVNQVTADVYVVDAGNDRIQQFTALGAFVRQWGSAGSGNGQFGTATAIAVHPDSGNVWVADSTRADLQEFTPVGVFVQKLGASGSGDGQFQSPSGLAFDASGGSIYVADLTQDRVQWFVSSATPPSGTFAAEFAVSASSASANEPIARIMNEDRRPVGRQPALGPLFIARTNNPALQPYPCVAWYDRLDGLLGIVRQAANAIPANAWRAQGALFRPPEDAYFYRVGAEIVDLSGGNTGTVLIDAFRLLPDSPVLSIESDNDGDLGTLVFEASWREAWIQ